MGTTLTSNEMNVNHKDSNSNGGTGKKKKSLTYEKFLAENNDDIYSNPYLIKRDEVGDLLETMLSRAQHGNVRCHEMATFLIHSMYSEYFLLVSFFRMLKRNKEDIENGNYKTV